MRSYSSFLLFEDVLDFVPQDNFDLYQFVQRVIKPRVMVSAEDCFTTLGKFIPTNYEIEGFIELATGLAITKTRIDTLLAAGTYFVAIRHLFSCVEPVGICRTCYRGTFLDQTPPAVGTFINISPEFNYQTDVLIGNGANTTFTLTEDPANYDKVLVFINGTLQDAATYTITDLSMVFDTPPPGNAVVKFYKTSSQPFMGFLADTYSGSILGLRPLPTETINIRPSLMQGLLTDEELAIARENLTTNYKTIARGYLDYIDGIDDRLEKAIYLSVLYGLYSNVTT